MNENCGRWGRKGMLKTDRQASQQVSRREIHQILSHWLAPRWHLHASSFSSSDGGLWNMGDNKSQVESGYCLSEDSPFNYHYPSSFLPLFQTLLRQSRGCLRRQLQLFARGNESNPRGYTSSRYKWSIVLSGSLLLLLLLPAFPCLSQRVSSSRLQVTVRSSSSSGKWDTLSLNCYFIQTPSWKQQS